MFAVDGLRIEGAKVENDVLFLTDEPSKKLPLAIFSWESATETANNLVSIPLYYDIDRHTLVTTVQLRGSAGTTATNFIQRGAAIIACDANMLKGSDGRKNNSVVDYSSLTYNEMRSLCKKRGLSAGGKKTELLERLNNSDVANK